LVLYIIDITSLLRASMSSKNPERSLTMPPRTSPFLPSSFSIGGQIGSRLDPARLTDALEAGQTLPDFLKTSGLDALDTAAALAVIGLEANHSQGPPLQTGQPTDPRWKPWLAPKTWSVLLPDAHETEVLNLSAGLLQIHDFWEESHEAAQKADDLGERRLSALWHAICHRREPDPGNAGYWYARVGKNPISQSLVEIILASRPEPGSSEKALADRLISRDEFNDRAMVAACNSARNGSAEERFLRSIQKIELALVFARTLEFLS